jgi:glycosyltransferase 2 family protein
MPFPPHVQPAPAQRVRLKPVLGIVTKWTLAAVLLFAAGGQIIDGLRQLTGQKISFFPLPLIFSAVLYASGMAFFGSYWRQTVCDMGGQLRQLESQRAYFVSQLGKYVPGKAWVLLIRCGLTSPQTVTRSVVVASTLYETLAMMAAGSLIALFTLLAAGVIASGLLVIALTLAAGLMVIIQPQVFGRLIGLGMLPFRKWGADPVKPITYATLLKAIRYLGPGWGLVSLSFVAAVQGVGVSLANLSAVLLLIGSMALAIAGGFAVFIVPAGLGVREWILMQTLTAMIGSGNAVLVAVVARVLNVAAELLAAGTLHLFAMSNDKNA